MATIEFRVGKHEMLVTSALSSGRYPTIVFYSEMTEPLSRRFSLAFIPPGSPVPPPSTQLDASTGEINDGEMSLSAEFIPLVLDLLRNEHPVWAALSTDDPALNSLFTKNILS